MSSGEIQRTFKTKKEAHSYRISKMLPRLVTRNEYLCNVSYQMCRGVEEVAKDAGYWTMSRFLRDSDDLKDVTDEYKYNMSKICYKLKYASYDLLKLTDERLEKSLNLLNYESGVPSVDELTQVLINERANDNVGYFKNKLKIEGIRLLNINRAEVEATKGKYKVLVDKPDSPVGYKVWNDFEQAMLMDEKLKGRRAEVQTRLDAANEVFRKAGGSRLYDKDAITDTTRRVKAAVVERDTCNILFQEIDFQRRLLNAAYPVSRIMDSTTADLSSKSKSYEQIVIACKNAQLVFTDVENKIISGDMPLYKMDMIVNKVLAEEGICPENRGDYSAEVTKWLKKVRDRDARIEVLGMVIPLAIAVACIFAPIGLGAIIVLGAIGAGVGGVAAAYEFEIAHDLHQAGKASSKGSADLVDPEEAKRQFVMASVTLCLSIVDAFLAGKAVVQLVKVSKVARGIKGAGKILNKLDEATLKSLNKLSKDDLAKALKLSSDPSKTADILLKLNNKGFKALTQADDWDAVSRMFKNAKNPDQLIQYINDADFVLEAGTKGSWNKVMNGNLEANSNYLVDGKYIYITDDAGRVSNVSGELDLKARGRNNYQQGKSVDIKDGVKGQDDGGHLIAQMFDGPGEQMNYVPMNSAINRSGGDWHQLEQMLKSELSAGRKVDIDIKMIYPQGSKRPDTFQVFYSIDDGMPKFREFSNN